MPSRLTVVLVSLLMATPAVIFWLWLMILPTRVLFICPEKCKCEESGYHIECSGPELGSVPLILPTHVRELLLCNISIPILENDSFVSKGLVELETILADYCKISKIEFGAFNGLRLLTHLSMEGNEISEIIPGTFEKMSRLDYLRLHQNRIDQLDSETFYGLVNLKNLGLEGNKLQYLNPDTFVNLPNLQGLYLSSNIGLQIPTGRNFIKSHSLKHLIISGCNVSSVSVETFANVGALEWLDLGFNYLRSLDINILNVLPELSNLDLEGNEISEIIPGTFEISRLECLYLEYNKIEHLGIDTFRGLVNLKNISLEGNKLQYLHPDMFIGLPNLQRLFLLNNSDLQIPNDRHFVKSLSLKRLYISGCNVSSMSVQSFSNVSTLESIDLRYNYLRILDIGILKELPELFSLNLKWNEISEIIPDTSVKFSRLKYLHLDYNKIERLESDTFRGLFNLNYITLKENKLQYLHPDTFFGLPNLQGLLLSYNSDLKIPTDRHFINSHSLKHLSISGCNINSVSVETFANVSALEVLDLSENYLSRVDINVLKILPQLSALYLYDNPLQCDCQLQEVWRWCQDHNIQTAYKEFAPECDTPSEVKEIWLGVLEKGQCLQGNIHYYGDYKNTRYSYTPIEDTDTETKKRETFVQQYILPIFAILFIFGTTGNVILIIFIICNKDMRTIPNMYILNLAISDTIYLIELFSINWSYPDPSQSGLIMCGFAVFCYRMSVSLTAYSIAALSIQRYRVTVNPLHFRSSSQPTWRATGATLCVVWILAALSAIPEVRSRFYCGAFILLGVTNYYHYVIIYNLLASCVIPLCVIALSYIMTARQLVKNSFSVSEGTQHPHLNTRKKAAKIVLGLTVIFLISYVPHHIWQTFLYFSLNSDISGESLQDKNFWIGSFQDILTIIYFFLLINSCLNPVALFCISLAFRRELKRHLTFCCKANSPPNDLELTRRN